MSNKRKLSKLAKEENQTNVASGAPSDSNVSPSQVSFTVSIDKAIKVDLTEKRVKKVQGNKVPTVPALNEEQKQLLHTNLCNTMNPAFYLVFSHTNVTAFVAVINSNADHRSRVPSYIMSSPATETNPLTAEQLIEGIMRAALSFSRRNSTSTRQAAARRVGEVIACPLTEFLYIHGHLAAMCHEPFFQEVLTSDPDVFPLAYHHKITSNKTFRPKRVAVAYCTNVIR